MLRGIDIMIDKQEFEDKARVLVKWLCENTNPHSMVVITPTTAVLYSGEVSLGEIFDYVLD